uniref:Uncharacterized protein n=2 Tax=Oryza TaxID=4527 RepID=A0A0E0HQN2_ORYNI
MNRRFSAKCFGAERSHLSAWSTGAEWHATVDGRLTRRANMSKFSTTRLGVEVANLSAIRYGTELRDIKAYPPRPREGALSILSLPRSTKTMMAKAAFLSDPNPPLTHGESRGFGGDFMWRLWSKPGNAGKYIVLVNMYVAREMWGSVAGTHEAMRTRPRAHDGICRGVAEG